MWIKTALGAHSADLQSADCLSQSQQAAEYAQSFLDQRSIERSDSVVGKNHLRSVWTSRLTDRILGRNCNFNYFYDGTLKYNKTANSSNTI